MQVQSSAEGIPSGKGKSKEETCHPYGPLKGTPY